MAEKKEGHPESLPSTAAVADSNLLKDVNLCVPGNAQKEGIPLSILNANFLGNEAGLNAAKGVAIKKLNEGHAAQGSAKESGLWTGAPSRREGGMEFLDTGSLL